MLTDRLAPYAVADSGDRKRMLEAMFLGLEKSAKRELRRANRRFAADHGLPVSRVNQVTGALKIRVPRGWIGSWQRKKQQAECLVQAATAARGFWGHELARRALRRHDRAERRAVVRALKQRLRALDIAPSAGSQTVELQISVTEMPIEPMAPCALMFA